LKVEQRTHLPQFGRAEIRADVAHDLVLAS
jgi:hypothetical protein